MKRKIKVFEAFTGIGAQRKALDNIGFDYEIVGLAEWYVPAIIAYHKLHDDVELIEDVSKDDMRTYLASKPLSIDSKKLVNKNYWNRKWLRELTIIYSYVKYSEQAGNIFDISQMHKFNKKIDLLTYSFPCQDVSVQGKGAGVKEGTRSGLLYEIEKYIKNCPDEQLPVYLLMENVKAIRNKKHLPELKKWIKYLESRGYETDIQTLNAVHFGSAQKRERVFALSSRDGFRKLPLENNNDRRQLKDIIDMSLDVKYRMQNLEKYELSNWQKAKRSFEIKRGSLQSYSTFASEAYVYDINHVGPTLTASGANSRIKYLWYGKIYRLNERECWEYMGFGRDDFEKVKELEVLTDNQLIFLAGNSICVQVLETIFKRLMHNWTYKIEIPEDKYTWKNQRERIFKKQRGE